MSNGVLWLSLLTAQTMVLVDGLTFSENFGIFAVLTILGTIFFAIRMKRTEGLSITACK